MNANVVMGWVLFGFIVLNLLLIPVLVYIQGRGTKHTEEAQPVPPVPNKKCVHGMSSISESLM